MATMDPREAERDCFVCRKHRGEIAVPGGAIYEDEVVYAGHAALPPDGEPAYLGWLFAEPKRHAAGLADLTDEEARSLGLLVTRLARALRAVTDAEHIHELVLGHDVAHLHVHVIPRYPGTPREFWGTRVDEWPGAPRGDAQQVAALCERLRGRVG